MRFREPNRVVPQCGVKICGIREPRHALVAVEAGADMLGFVFAPSRRRVTVEAAKACIDPVRGSSAAMIGLFVDASAGEINRTCRDAGLDAVQLHGDVTLDLLRVIERPVIQVLRQGSGEGILAPSEDNPDVPNQPVAYMIDAVVPGSHGGTGVLADWSLAAMLAGEVPLMLAGGLTPGTVADAIATVRPRAVDVSSGVETDGSKDEKKIRAFIEAATKAFGEAPSQKPDRR